MGTQSVSEMKSLNSKVEFLEKTLRDFQAEVEIKMKFVEQLFSNRTEQLACQKKLLEQEETLFQFLLNGWKNSIDKGQSSTYGAFEPVEEERITHSRNWSANIAHKNLEITRITDVGNREREMGSPDLVDLTICKTREISAPEVSNSNENTEQEPNVTVDPLEDNSDTWRDCESQGVENSQEQITGGSSASSQTYFSALVDVDSTYYAKIEPEVIEIESPRASPMASDHSIRTDSNSISGDRFQENLSLNSQPCSSNMLPSILPQTTNLNIFKCPVCGKFLRSQTALAHHHLTIHSRLMKFPCPECGKLFPRKGSLERHKLMHGAYKTLRCHDCPNVQFSGKEVLLEHMSSNHGIKKPWMCNFCKTAFVQRKKLQQHILSAHPGMNTNVGPPKKRFPCLMCSKTYTTRNDLQVHYRLHTGERPFICQGCQKSFADRRNMKKHVETCLQCKTSEDKDSRLFL